MSTGIKMKTVKKKNAHIWFFSLVILVFSQFAKADSSQFKLDMILAKRGDADAQYYVAMAYEEGRGIKKDLKQAFQWYAKSAKQGQYGAQYKMGDFYEHGYAVKKNNNTAFVWYRKAADNGSSMARKRLNRSASTSRSEQAEQRRIAALKAAQEKKETQVKRRAAEKKKQLAMKKADAKARPVKVAKPIKVAKKEKKVVTKINIPDLINLVLSNKWSSGTYSADYLPSSSTNCLKASAKELVCFSKEKARMINSVKVTYTTKSTLSNFKRNGSFNVKYFYNVMKLDSASEKGPRVDPLGLRAEEGWQEPQLAMNCHTTDQIYLTCSKGKMRVKYRR